MAPDNDIVRLEQQLNSVVEHMGGDLDRVELLAAALSAFNRPVPDYEPRFRHLRDVPLDDYELSSQLERARKSTRKPNEAAPSNR